MILITNDQTGRNLNISKKANRIVCLVPYLTEILCELNLEEKLVGITEQCIYPFYLKTTKVIVGNAKKPYIEKIEALQPDIVFCDSNLHSSETINQLNEITNVYVANVSSLQKGKELISQLGTLFNCKTESSHFIEKLNYKLSDFKKFTENRKPLKIAYFTSSHPWESIENDSFANELFELNKFENIYQKSNTNINIKKIRFEGDPNAILLASDIYSFTDEDVFEIGEYANRSATVFVNSKMFSWFGARTLQAFDYFKELHKRLESHF